MAKVNEDIKDIIIQFVDKETQYKHLDSYYEKLLKETGDYKEYRKT